MSEAEKDKVWEDLHDVYAPKLKHLLLKLRGAYTKVGQVCPCVWVGVEL
jgi:hypothetical protein